MKIYFLFSLSEITLRIVGATDYSKSVIEQKSKYVRALGAGY